MVSRGGSGKLGLSEQGKELLGLLLEEEGFRLSRALTIAPRQDDGPPPLSFAQERLWFLCQFDPEGIYYNIPMALLCTGWLDVAALEKSLSTILARHEVLRAVFHNVGGQPVQHFLPPKSISLPPIDLRDLPPSEREARTQQLIIEEAQRPFDLERGPLLRAQLLRLDNACLEQDQRETHILLVTVHHIVADGVSYDVLMRELQALYTAFVAGEPAPLPDLSFQFADFAHWQRQWLQDQVLERELDYWRQKLHGIPSALDLPTDRPRPPVQTYWGSRCSRVLGEEMTWALKALSRRLGISLFVTLLTAFKVLLQRYTGQDDIVVGSPVANRNYSGVEDLIGLFVNTLVLRTDLSGDPTFKELAGRVSKVVLGAYEHQDVPFEKLVQVLQPERSTSHTPFFQVAFNFQSTLVFDLDLPDLHVRLLEQPAGVTKFSLTLDVNEVDGKLLIALEYNTAMFVDETAGQMLAHLERLLAGIIEDAARPISVLPLLLAQDRQQILEVWNNTQTAYPRQRCVHELFEAQAAQTPHAVALVFEGAHLTYNQLNRRANQAARHLRALGVGPEMLAGICVERSLEMVIGLLGILKAGGAYAPLDPTYPQERLAFMLDDAQVPVLLTQQRLVQDLPEHTAKVVYLDTDWPLIARQSGDNLPNVTAADNLAYVMYTSGSTGRPKGTSIVHRAVVRLVQETNFADLSAGQIWLQFAPLSFDASTLELWGSLLNGGRLVIFPPHTPSLNELGQVLLAQQVTALWLTAGLFHLMVDERLADLGRLRQLLAGGDVLSPPHVQKALHALPNCRLINGYGPTENTTFTTCYPMTPGSQARSPLPIGRPIANTQVYILDARLQPQPIGVPGELYIGGDGLARDYLHRAGLTAERFVPHPFAEESGARLYKTGDLARYLPDGNVEFIGRRDQQVKVHGFRIELSEIEIALSEHSGIQSVVAIARQDRPGEKRLVAYIVPHDRPPTFSAMRDFLRQKLPEYMIPTAFIVLEQIPLNPNGKVDWRALPAPEKTRAEPGTRHVAPRNPVEERLVEIWTDLLQQKRIGVHDNFFELGGHSLLATRIVSQIEATLQVSLPLRVIFELPTVADLAQEIARRQAGEYGSVEGDEPIGRLDRSREGELLANHLDQLSDQELDSFLEQMLSGSE